jgi:hypothetical protein
MLVNGSSTVAALVFGASGRLGKVMLQGLAETGIEPMLATRAMLSNFTASGELPILPESIVLVDASIDYSDMPKHEAEKHAFIARLAQRSNIRLIASFSSGAVDFEDALIANSFYLEYKRVKQHNLAFFQSLGTRLFYPKVYTLVGPNSFAVKSTGWVQVLESAASLDDVAIAHPGEPRSWVSEHCVRHLFTSFVASNQPQYLEAPVCGTFRLADIVSLCETRRERRLAIQPGQANPWLAVPYVAPHPAHVDACNCDLGAQLASLLDTSSAP